MPRPETPGLKQRILRAAEAAFTRRGFHAVSVRDIAAAARTPMANLYAHFGSKERLFRALLARYEEEYLREDQPLARAFGDFRLPDSLEAIGRASGETVRKFANYIRLIYVDVIEFRGRHIARMFREMRLRYEANLGPALRELRRQRVLGPADPVLALMAVTLAFFNYYTVEYVFGARRHFGLSDEQVVRELSTLFRHGLMARNGEA